MKIPVMFQPDWTQLNCTEFIFSFGDEVIINTESQKINAIILDFSEDEMSKWYGVGLLNKRQLLGRKIPSGLSKNSITLLDIFYLTEKLVNNLQKLDTHQVEQTQIGIGARCPITDISFLQKKYSKGIQQRNDLQTKSQTKVVGFQPIECYVSFSEILK
ncbi:MAG: hypothetical protein AB8G22_04035 [Saprospiraceae bacterium]